MSQVISSIVCGSNDSVSETSQALLKLALNLAEKGSSVIFICRSALSEFSILGSCEYAKRPEVLERVNLRYFTTKDEIISWCHSLHTARLKPDALFLCKAEEFIETKFDMFELCSALLDCLSYCSKRSGTETYLCISLNDMTGFKYVALNNLFQNIWRVGAG